MILSSNVNLCAPSNAMFIHLYMYFLQDWKCDVHNPVLVQI